VLCISLFLSFLWYFVWLKEIEVYIGKKGRKGEKRYKGWSCGVVGSWLQLANLAKPYRKVAQASWKIVVTLSYLMKKYWGNSRQQPISRYWILNTHGWGWALLSLFLISSHRTLSYGSDYSKPFSYAQTTNEYLSQRFLSLSISCGWLVAHS